MNIEKTKEYKVICSELNRFLLDDLESTLIERRINAEIRFRANQRAFLEALESKGINMSIEGIEDVVNKE